MKVILLKNIPKVGQKYDVKDISDGHALNFLIPKKLAEVATPSAIKKMEVLRVSDMQKKSIQADLLAKNMGDLNGVRVEFTEKASDKGHLFSSIHKEALAGAIKAQTRLDINADFIDLPKPIKEVGEHKVTVKIGDKSAEVVVVVNAVKQLNKV